MKNRVRWSATEDMLLQKAARKFNYQTFEDHLTKLTVKLPDRPVEAIARRVLSIRKYQNIKGNYQAAIVWTQDELDILNQELHQFKYNCISDHVRALEQKFPTKRFYTIYQQLKNMRHTLKIKSEYQWTEKDLNQIQEAAHNYQDVLTIADAFPQKSYQAIMKKMYDSRKMKGIWFPDEVQRLQQEYEIHGPNWEIIARKFRSKTAAQCFEQYVRMTKGDREDLIQKIESRYLNIERSVKLHCRQSHMKELQRVYQELESLAYKVDFPEILPLKYKGESSVLHEIQNSTDLIRIQQLVSDFMK